MKKMLALVAIAAAFSLTSCGGGGFEADVRKAAEMGCKLDKLSKDSTKADEAKAFAKEAEEFTTKMGKKYEDKKGDKDMEAKAEKIIKEVMEKCK
jgi:spermidine/putrescine-binding protein